MCYSHTSQAKNARCRDRREQVTSTSSPKRSGTCFTMVWSIESRASDITQDLQQWHKPSIDAEKKSYKEALGPTTRQITVNPKQISTKIHLSYMFETCVNIKHHKLETPGAETRENRSLPRQLQRRVEQTLLRCEHSSAERPTKYTRLAAMTQVFHRSRKKYLTRKHWTLQHAKTTVNREKCPSKISPLKYIWPMCYSQTSQA